MTIAVIWQEDGFQWCAADTRLVADPDDRPMTEIAAKIYAIPVVVGVLEDELKPRQPHYWTQFGFVYAGAALPASMTAVTASTLLQKLARPGGRTDLHPSQEHAILCNEERPALGSGAVLTASIHDLPLVGERLLGNHVDAKNSRARR